MCMKVYVVEVRMEVACVDGIFMGNLALLTRHRFMEKHVLLLHFHLEGAQSTGYTQV